MFLKYKDAKHGIQKNADVQKFLILALKLAKYIDLL